MTKTIEITWIQLERVFTDGEPDLRILTILKNCKFCAEEFINKWIETLSVELD